MSGSSFLVGAEVRIPALNLVAVTNSEGRFDLRRVPVGEHELVVSYIGLGEERRAVTVAPGQTFELRLALGAGDAARVEDVIVTAARPIAESEAAALQVQRSSTSLVNVVAADSIGRFPDQNVAAALSRLPGIAIQRDQGQERFVNLRGSPNRWTTIAFDGVNVVSPAGRVARFDTVPAAIASQVQARKAITPQMPGETVAGNINIITRGPFDYPGFKAAGDVGIGINELGGGEQYNIGGYVSNVFGDGRFGALISASHYSRDMVTDNFETDWAIVDEDQEPGGEERGWAEAFQNKLYRLTRTNSSVTGRLDFRPSDDHRIFLSSIFTQFTDDELRNANEFDFAQGATETSETPVGRSTGFADVRTGNTPFQGRIFNVELDNTQNFGRSRQDIFTNTLGGDHRLGVWGAQWRLNYTRARDYNEPGVTTTWRSPSNGAGRRTVDYDFTDREANTVRLFNTIRNADGSFSAGAPNRSLQPQDYAFVNFRRGLREAVTDAYSVRADIDREIALVGMPTEIRFGAQWDNRTKENNQSAMEVLPATLAAAGIPLPTQADISIERPYEGELSLGYDFRYHGQSRVMALMDDYLARGGGRVQPNVKEQNYYKVTEEVLAGYGMATTFFDWGNIVAGARIERTENTGEALVNQGNGFQPIETSGDNVQVFPSAHINWDINDEMKLRLSFNTGSARPDYTELRPNFSFNDEDQEVSGGNPDAGPEKAVGVDAYFEWYMRPQGFFSAGVYYKSLSDILFDIEVPAFGRDILNTPGIDRSGYTFFTVGNGGDGFIRGLEFAYSQQLGDDAERLGLPAWVGGFGVQANLTLNESEATTPDGRDVRLPGASDVVYNAAVYYERYGLSTRLSWQNRTEWIDSIGNGGPLGDAFWDETGRLDFSVRYEVSDSAEWYFDANNLLNEPGVRYRGIKERTSEYESFGVRYLMGLRVNF